MNIEEASELEVKIREILRDNEDKLLEAFHSLLVTPGIKIEIKLIRDKTK